MVDSTPTSLAPPSSIKSSSPNSAPISSATSLAEVGDTEPNLFALGAATPWPPSNSNSLKSFRAIGFDGIRSPTNS